MTSSGSWRTQAPIRRRLWLGLPVAALLALAPLTAPHAESAPTQEQVSSSSVAAAKKALDELKAIAAKAPDNLSLQRALAGAYLRLAEALKSKGDLGEALTQLREGLAIIETAIKKDPASSSGQFTLSRFYKKIGDVLKAQGATAAALRSYREELAISTRLAAQDPAATESQRSLASSYASIGETLSAEGDYAGALQNYQQSLAIANRLSQNDPGDSEARAALDATQQKVRETVRKLAGGDEEMTVGGHAAAPAPQPSPALPMFPWPPPQASATYVLPEPLLADYPTVGAVTGALLSALETNGYVERSFYGTPQGGVALVTRLERINDDGSPVADTSRWPASGPRGNSTGDLIAFLRGLFYVDPGHYRVIVFVLQDLPFTQSRETITTSEQARAWLSGGANVLPPGIAAAPFAGANCTALIYEFASDGKRVRVVTSRLTGKGHLQRAGVLTALDHAE